MGNFTKIERYLHEMEGHLKIIADSVNGSMDIEIFNTVSNLYLSMDEVVFVEGKKIFGGIEFTVYLESGDNEAMVKELEKCESVIKKQHPNSSVIINYAPIENEKNE